MHYVQIDIYRDLLERHLKSAIKSKRRGLLSMARAIAEIIEFCLEYLPHLEYYPDVAPSDFRMSKLLQDPLGGNKIGMDDEVKTEVYT